MGVLYFSLGVGKEGDGFWVVFSWKMDPQEAEFHSQHPFYFLNTNTHSWEDFPRGLRPTSLHSFFPSSLSPFFPFIHSYLRSLCMATAEVLGVQP